MACYKPIKGWRSRQTNPSGRRSIVFQIKNGYADQEVLIPCGRCIGCRIERSRQWALRCQHESSLYDENCFITLTYNDDNLPTNRSVNVRVLQLFIKRLREHYSPRKIRYYACGEYGAKTMRPHYHALIFNLDFEDKKPWKKIRDNTVYTSEKLQSIWGLGFCSVGALSFQSSAYVARYIMKKVTGPLAQEHYEWTDPNTGEIYQRLPEFNTMSTQPGLGRKWLEKYETDVFPSDEVIVEGRQLRVPNYYNNYKKQKEEREYKKIKAKRNTRARKSPDNTPARLKVRETIQTKRAERLGREL